MTQRRTARFSWDDDKAASNLAKHEVAFDEAIKVFDDTRKVEWFDGDHSTPDEERWKLVGHSGSKMLHVVFTERGARQHIISARKADKNDRKAYKRQRR